LATGLSSIREKEFVLVHCAVVGDVYAVFVEAAKKQLLNVSRANVQMSLPVLFEIHE